MGNFDALAKQVFSTVTNVMGVNAVWQTSKGDRTPGKVLFKNPTESINIGGSEQYEYRPNQTTAEFHDDTFPGLKQTVDAGTDEYLIIDGQTYFITEVTTKVDGRTVVAHLEPHNENE